MKGSIKMASNRLEDLNNMLFNQLVRLDKDDISDEEMNKEINRSKAMNGIAHTIVDNAVPRQNNREEAENSPYDCR